MDNNKINNNKMDNNKIDNKQMDNNSKIIIENENDLNDADIFSDDKEDVVMEEDMWRNLFEETRNKQPIE